MIFLEVPDKQLNANIESFDCRWGTVSFFKPHGNGMFRWQIIKTNY